MSEKTSAEKIIEYLDCPCEICPEGKNYKRIKKWYEDSLEDGKLKGYTPLIIIPNDVLEETIYYNFSEENCAFSEIKEEIKKSRENIIKESKNIRAEDFFQRYIDELKDEDDEYLEYINEQLNSDIEENSEGLTEFISFSSRNGDTEEVILAKIPTTKAWELAAWIPMGGWNSCPSPEEQVAIFKYWYEKYEAYPAVVSSDIWELRVKCSPNDDSEKAMDLAKEQYIWCNDRIDQCGSEDYTLGTLGGELMNSSVWYFWWD